MTLEESAARVSATAQPQRTSSIATFASVIEVFELPHHKALNQRLLEAIRALRATTSGISSSNHGGGWHSERDLFKREEPPFREICSHIEAAIVQNVRRYWHDFKPDQRVARECWANVNGKHGFNVPHAHSEFHVSGSYYVATPATSEAWSGAIEFLNPNGAIQPFLKMGNRMNPARYRLQPKAGQIILFPAYLQHWVYPNQEDEERVSLAFNFAVLE